MIQWLKAVLVALMATLVGAGSAVAAPFAGTHYDTATYVYVQASPPARNVSPTSEVRGPASRPVVGAVKTPDSRPPVGVAAKTADEVADVGHAGIHQFPGTKVGKSQFYDAEDLGRLSNTEGIPGVLQKNGNTRYVMRGAQEVGVDRTTGLPTDVYTVIRKPDGSVLTMFPGTSPRS